MTRRITLFLLIFCLTYNGFTQNLPDAPKFLSASVIPDSEPTTVLLEWEASDSASVIGYIIYLVEGITTELDIVEGRFNTTYSYTDSNSDSDFEIFRLSSFDSDTNKSMLTNPHQTMLLNLELDKCNDFVDLEWTEYLGWGDEIKHYKVFRREEETAYSLLTTVGSDKLTYTDSSAENEKMYYYYIEAESKSGIKATSNSKSIFTESYEAPSYLYAQSASVDNDNIQVRFRVDNTAEVMEYRISRSLKPNGNFQNVASFPNTGQSEISWTDTDVKVNENRYYYKISSLNPCAVVSAESNVASNIILSKDEELDLYHSFLWTDYIQWDNGVEKYKVYRSFDNVTSEIGNTSNSNLKFTYNIENYVSHIHSRQQHLTNKFCYYVVAYEDYNNNPTGVQGRSRSNKVCFFHEPVIYIPNAISTTSFAEENRVFKPVISFVEREPYELVIIDRWGLEIFRTTEPHKGWDGTFRYTIAPPQQYLYIIRYYDHQGQEHIKTGSFSLNP